MGIFDKIKGAFTKGATVVNTIVLSEFDQVIANSRMEYAQTNTYFWGIKLNTVSVYTEQVAKWDDKKKIDLIVYCLIKISDQAKSGSGFSSRDIAYQNNSMREAYLSQLFKTKLAIDEEDLDRLIRVFTENKKWHSATLNQWPVASLLNQLDRQYGKTGLSENMVRSLDHLKNDLKKIDQVYYEKEKLKLIEKIDQLTFNKKETDQVKPTLFLGDDAFSAHANQVVQSLPTQEQQIWYQLITKAQKATGSKPSNKYLQESKDLFKALGAEKFKMVTNNWFVFVINLKETTKEHRSTWDNREYVYYSSTFLSTINTEAIKGFVWMCSNFHDSATLNTLAKLAERCYKKMPGVGPAAASVGNACLYALYKSKGLDGIGHLSRLKLRIKQASTQQIIEKYIQEAAKEQGVSTHEVEDMAVDDFGLINGTREFQFDNFTCTLKITGVGRSELNWYKPDGVQQKTVPTAVKEKQAAKLKKTKDIQKQVDQTTSAQRDRIDRLFRTGRQMNIDDFKSFFLEHGLMSFLANKIIWNVTQNEQTTAVILLNGQWVTNEDKVITLNANGVVYLWHPVTETIAEVKKWREFLIHHQIQQPLKQAFREIYVLTEAEVNTRSYSNRMAAHVLKQHQLNMLAKTRGWKYALLGAFDNGINSGIAQINLPEYKLKAEYWVNEVNADNNVNDTGIWNYVTTDQVRFLSAATNEVVDLVDVPALPLSEVLRDVDLFVGVASVGNDPAWRDSGGLPAYNNYWTSYSFGDLSELAKNRKEILSGLIPRLKISQVAEIQDKFLVVKGKLRTYKIHIGSTNILMEPNDQYLCIVPDRGAKSYTEGLFIPFEGDSGISLILSKAFLLADDEKITDRTITLQINRK